MILIDFVTVNQADIVYLEMFLLNYKKWMRRNIISLECRN
jgi:uncharacterized membrane protein